MKLYEMHFLMFKKNKYVFFMTPSNQLNQEPLRISIIITHMIPNLSSLTVQPVVQTQH